MTSNVRLSLSVEQFTLYEKKQTFNPSYGSDISSTTQAYQHDMEEVTCDEWKSVRQVKVL